MIVADNLKDIFNREEDKNIILAIETYLAQNPGLTNFKPGEKEMISNGIAAIAIQAESGATNKNLLEAHKKFCDLHYTLQGIDTIAYKPVSNCSHINKSYNEEGDYLLYDEAPDKTLTVAPGNFCFSPNEFAHMALYDSHGPVSKLVFKIPVL